MRYVKSNPLSFCQFRSLAQLEAAAETASAMQELMSQYTDEELSNMGFDMSTHTAPDKEGRLSRTAHLLLGIEDPRTTDEILWDLHGKSPINVAGARAESEPCGTKADTEIETAIANAKHGTVGDKEVVPPPLTIAGLGMTGLTDPGSQPDTQLV